MKRTVLCLVCFLLLLSGCKMAPSPEIPSDDAPVTEVDVFDESENYDIEYQGTALIDFICAYSLQELINRSDYIVIASTDVPYSDAEQKVSDFMANPMDDFEKADLIQSYTVRPFTVKKVIKGDERETIDLCQNIIVKDNRMRVCGTEYPVWSGEEYILFLIRANGEREMYCMEPTQGAFNLDFDKNIGIYGMNQTRAYEVKEYYKEYFENNK